MTCPVCDAPVIQPRTGRRRVYCTDECRRAALLARRNAEAQARRSSTVTECAWCLRPFTPTARIDERYCSTTCCQHGTQHHIYWGEGNDRCPLRWLDCTTCGTTYLRPTGQHIYQQCPPCTDQRIQARSAAKNAARRGATVAGDPITVHALAERDGTRCALCRRPVNMNLRHPHPMAPTIDHIIPIKHDPPGHHTWANTQLAHFRCNTSKSNRAANDQLRLM